MRLLKFINGKNYINGKWCEFKDTISVTNPATDTIIGEVPNLPLKIIQEAIDSTAEAFHLWSQTSFEQRSTILKKWHSLILENIDELADILTLEQGKPLEDAKNEILYGASFVEWFAHNIYNIQGTIKSGYSINHKIITEYEPVGPVAAITPWNFPSAMITRKITPALGAGCSIILKPSELTPFSALALAKLSVDAGYQ